MFSAGTASACRALDLPGDDPARQDDEAAARGETGAGPSAPGSGDAPAGSSASVPTGSSGLALPATALDPADNPTSPAKVDLGRQLFWDPILSGDRSVACATCHDPAFAYADGRPLSFGVGGPTTRSSMTILDTAFNGLAGNRAVDPTQAPMFWDSRVRSLEEQARGPIKAAGEMRGTAIEEALIFPELVTRLQAIPEYVGRFEASFGADAITETSIVQALAAFERTLVDQGSSYDRFARGDRTALSAAQQRGMAIFDRGGCPACHSGPMFSDFRIHRLGVPDLPGAARDQGAGGGGFRTASLRNITRTAPYMHDGVFRDLEQVFGFYARVDRRLDPALANLRAPAPFEAADVKAFLGALGDGTFDTTVPTSVPSGLTPGGTLQRPAR